MKVFYSNDYTASDFAFDTTRKSQWIADSLVTAPIAGVDIVEPRPATEQMLRRAHTRQYIQSVKTGRSGSGKKQWRASSSGFTWDRNTFKATTASSGGMVDAAYAALQDGVAGTLSSGLHHARHDYGAGFCTFNGLAVAAKELLARGAVENVLIVDFDAHCGGGTQSIIRDDNRIRHVDVSVDNFDSYKDGDLKMVDKAEDYLWQCSAALFEAIDFSETKYDICLYNAGMDPYQECFIGGLQGIDKQMIREREQFLFSVMRSERIPTAFTLAGGYSNKYTFPQSELVGLHRETIKAAVRSDRLAVAA